MSIFFKGSDEDCYDAEALVARDFITDRLIKLLNSYGDLQGKNMDKLELDTNEWTEWSNHFSAQPPWGLINKHGLTQIVLK